MVKFAVPFKPYITANISISELNKEIIFEQTSALTHLKATTFTSLTSGTLLYRRIISPSRRPAKDLDRLDKRLLSSGVNVTLRSLKTAFRYTESSSAKDNKIFLTWMKLIKKTSWQESIIKETTCKYKYMEKPWRTRKKSDSQMGFEPTRVLRYLLVYSNHLGPVYTNPFSNDKRAVLLRFQKDLRSHLSFSYRFRPSTLQRRSREKPRSSVCFSAILTVEWSGARSCLLWWRHRF